jgi:hypothetical protein
MDFLDRLELEGDAETKLRVQELRKTLARLEELRENCPLKRLSESHKPRQQRKQREHRILPPSPAELEAWEKEKEMLVKNPPHKYRILPPSPAELETELHRGPWPLEATTQPPPSSPSQSPLEELD